MLRINELLRKSGYFWLPSTPEKRVPGSLIISEGGQIELEIVGIFDESIDGLNRAINGKADIGRINGDIESEGLITLDQCFYKSTNISLGGISKASVHANRAFIGVAYDDGENILFNSFKFAVEGIDEWVGLSGISVERNYEKRTASITYSPPEEITINLDNGMSLKITFFWTLPGSPHAKEAKITQKTYFNLSSDVAYPLDEFISVAHKVTTLLCFAIDETVCIEQVFATSDEITREMENSKACPVSIAVYYPSLPYTDKIPKVERHRMLFHFKEIQKDAERIINNWIGAYSVIDPAINLYFSSRTGAHKYLDGTFLALAQCLETYHRRTSNEKLMDDEVFKSLKNEIIENCPKEHQKWLSERLSYGNEISLRERLKRIIAPFEDLVGSGKERKNLIRSIVDSRNYLTHYDERLSSRVSKGKDLWSLCSRMEAIFQLHLLQVLGFTEEEVQSVFENSRSLQNKLRMRN